MCLFRGRLVKDKGIKELIKAYMKLNQDAPQGYTYRATWVREDNTREAIKSVVLLNSK